MTIELNEDNFEAEVIASNVPVLVDFWATWCGSCGAQSPILDSLAQKATHFKVGKVDVTTDRKLAETYQVTRIPTLILFQKGKVVETLVGTQGMETLEKLMADAVDR